MFALALLAAVVVYALSTSDARVASSANDPGPNLGPGSSPVPVPVAQTLGTAPAETVEKPFLPLSPLAVGPSAPVGAVANPSFPSSSSDLASDSSIAALPDDVRGKALFVLAKMPNVASILDAHFLAALRALYPHTNLVVRAYFDRVVNYGLFSAIARYTGAVPTTDGLLEVVGDPSATLAQYQTGA